MGGVLAKTSEGEKREKIYLHGEDGKTYYNPYSYSNYSELFTSTEKYYKFLTKLKEIVKWWDNLKIDILLRNNEEKKKFLECFLKKLPQAAIWKKEHIEEANVLLISNEPGLRKIENVYKNFLKCENELDLDKITEWFYISMISWLALVNHPNLGTINGEGSNTEKKVNDRGSTSNNNRRNNPNIYNKFKLFGKIGYFMKDDNDEIYRKLENLRNQGTLKCIHIDLFPFAQEWGSDENDKNCKDYINDNIENIINSVINNQNFDCNSTSNSDEKFICRIIKKNIETIKTFCDSASVSNKKYVFIIGNRAILKEDSVWYSQNKNDRSPTRNNNININYFIPFSNSFYFFDYINGEPRLKDYTNIIFKILEKIILQNNHIKCRLIPSWPSRFGYKTILTLSSGVNTIIIRRDDDIEVDIEVIELREVN